MKTKKNSKGFVSFKNLALLVLLGFWVLNLGDSTNEAQTRMVRDNSDINESLPELEVSFNTSAYSIPYGNGMVRTLDYIEASYGEDVWDSNSEDNIIAVIPSVEYIDSNVLGETEVTYDISVQDTGESTQLVKVFNVIDNENPTLELAQSNVDIVNGGSFDAQGYIANISDNIDGDFVYLETEPEESVDYNWYTIKTDVDTYQPGEYTVKYIVGDSYGNRTSKSLQVNVSEPVYVEPEPVQVAPQAYYVLNTNTKKFHYSWCSSVNQMSAKNRYDYTGTRNEVVSWGYVPCQRCYP